MRRGSALVTMLVAFATVASSVAGAQADSSSTTATSVSTDATTVAPTTRPTTTLSPTTAAPAPAATSPDPEPDPTSTDAPERRATTSTAPPTTKSPIKISATSIAVPGYNPDWRDVNPPWVPKAPAFSGWGRRIVYDISSQRVWLIEDNGFITRTHLVSGNYSQPRPGYYSVYSRSRYTFAAFNPVIRWEYMVRFAVGASGLGIGFHQIPTKYGVPLQSISQLGQALSAGCVRQAPADAEFVWYWAPVGTPVVVTW